MLLHLVFLSNFGVNALPIFMNTSDNHKSAFDQTEKVILSENRTNLSSIVANIQVPKDFNLNQIAKDLKDFGIAHLKDDKHMDGLPLDREGKINPDFHKEIFLGNHELFESQIQNDVQKRNQKLEEIFHQGDQDHDQRLSHEELLNYVFKNVQDHLKEAKDRNIQLFLMIDTNQDGKVTWQEYAALYVKLHHMNESEIKDLDDINFIQESFDENLIQELLKIRFRWTEADAGDDKQLHLDEFLAFRHPEIVGRTYKYLVDEMIAQMDEDDDLKLNETEFINAPSHLVETNGNKEWAELDRRWIEQQRMEFHEIDEDKDGFLSRDELIKTYDPLNRAHINLQIKRLFLKVDDSPKDDSISIDEIKKHADVFTDMRILDTDGTLHDEM